MTGQPDNGYVAAERPITNDESTGAGRTWLDARDRYDELTQRDLLARARAKLRARGEYDPARHGTGPDPEPLPLHEHLEVLANGEVVARVYRHPGQVHHALEAGATWKQIADATGTDEARARQEYREFADGQHRLWQAYEGRWGLDDAEYAAAVARAGQDDGEPSARVHLESEGLRQAQAYLNQAAGPQTEAGQ
jgi:hypothetical protein